MVLSGSFPSYPRYEAASRSKGCSESLVVYLEYHLTFLYIDLHAQVLNYKIKCAEHDLQVMSCFRRYC